MARAVSWAALLNEVWAMLPDRCSADSDPDEDFQSMHARCHLIMLYVPRLFIIVLFNCTTVVCILGSHDDMGNFMYPSQFNIIITKLNSFFKVAVLIPALSDIFVISVTQKCATARCSGVQEFSE